MLSQLGTLDLSLKPARPRLFLAKPNREIIAKLSEVSGIKREVSLTELSTLSFQLPYYVDQNNELVRNRNVDLLRERYHLKVVTEHATDWYIITKVNESTGDRGDSKSVQCIHLPQELNDKIIGGYKKDSRNARQVLEDVLSLTTSWSIGYMDADYELSYRSWEFPDNTLLDAVFTIMEKYNAIVEWDTEQRKINMIKPELHGTNKLGVFSHQKYLKSVDKESNAEIVVTRLRPIGKEGMGIERLTPSGSPYLEDFSYWMYPFERDSKGTTVQPSYFMSDELCHALLDYQQLQESYKGQFGALIEMGDEYARTQASRRTELNVLKNELAAITQIQLGQQFNDKMLFDQSTFNGGVKTVKFQIDPKHHYAVLIKLSDSSNKTVSVNNIPVALSGGKWELTRKLLGTGDVSVSLSGSGQAELFIQVANITNAEYSASNNGPAIINRYNFDHKKSEIADKETVIQQIQNQLNIIDSEKSQIQEALSLQQNFSPELIRELDTFIFEQKYVNESLIEAKDILEEGKKKFEEFRMPQLHLKMDIVNFLEYLEEQRNWSKLLLGDKVIVKYDVFNMLIEAKIVKIDFDYESSNISLTIANFKDLSTNRSMLEKYIYNSNKTTTIVNDHKDKWNQAIVDNSDFSRIFDQFWDKVTNQINMAVNQTVHIGDNGITVYDTHDPLRFLRMTNGAIGLTRSGGLRYETALTPDGIIAEMVLGKLILGQRVTIGDENGIWLTEGPKTTITDRCGRVAMKLGLYEENPDKFGMVIHRYDDVTPCSSTLLNRIITNSEEGFKIQQWDGREFKDKFYADLNGLLFAEDMTAKRLRIVSGSDELILDSYTKYMNIGKFDEIILDGKLTAIEKLQVLGERTRIISEYQKLLDQANTYKQTTRDTSIRINTDAFTSSYQALLLYLAPLLTNMDETSEIDRDEFIAKFKAYYDEVTAIINAINDSIKYSSVQFGSMFNNVLIDYATGITVTRSDNLYRSVMSGTRGFAIQRNTASADKPQWSDVFWADLNGIVHAQGIRIKDSFITDGGIEGSYIILRDGSNGVMKLYPSEGLWAGAEQAADAPFWVSPKGKLKIAGNGGSVLIDTEAGIMNLNNINVIGTGRIEADSIIVNTAIAGMGVISNLSVNKLITFDKADTVGTVADYIHIEKNKLMLKTGIIDSRTQLSSNEKLLFWTDSSKSKATTDPTPFPIWQLEVKDKDKFILGFEGSGNDGIPYIHMGLGDGVNGDSGKGIIRKPNGQWNFVYQNNNYARERRLLFLNDGMEISVETGFLEIKHDSGSMIKLNSNGSIDINANGAINFSGTQYNFK
ncbi:hypothetical protein D3P07_00640 [Paenibacillus sp. 1011MAR3C5]|uniref:phage tail spike protein n=1 Tax=Paenibacillus sp. 1011MAR3C5 TaxID=1675787 RepID=UPI000E6C064A|nr:phage tail spike protein [Paenibacillus sp. 1011MAR3C5]RJE90651.1 hypothetical protein D3P07_00640 [Paenibacillus sp. 1011MAR3C5]